MIGKLSIRLKILLSFLAIILVLVGTILTFITYQVSKQIVFDIEKTFVEKGELFDRIQQIRFRQLKQTAILLADVPALKAAISTGDKNTIKQKLFEELWPILDFDPSLAQMDLPEESFQNPDSSGILLICDEDGYPLAHLQSTPLPSFSIAERPGIRSALEGNYPEQSYIWELEGRFFIVITVPIWSGNDLMGTLTFGYPIRKEESYQLAKDVGSEVTFFVGSSIIASSFSDLSAEETAEFSKAIYNKAYEILFTDDVGTFFINLNNDSWMVYVTPMLSDISDPKFIPAFYVLATSYTKATGSLSQLQISIVFIALFSLLVAVAVGLVLTKRIVRPIGLLVDGIKKLDSGDFSHQVEVVSTDELGLLTKRYNTLVENLKERLEMLKFVSDATVNAIKRNLTSRDMGGQRKEVTVFFSDIRGFTTWSEKRPPEEVIKMLNLTLSVQADIVKSHNGDVDKFVGDELVAVFEGTEKDKNAVRAAMEIQQKLHEIYKLHQLEIGVGIGINTGAVVMGAMGSANRMDFTVIGNHVNLGARLCSAAKKGQILITEWSVRNLDRSLQVNELSPIEVKGIEKPVSIFEIIWSHE